MSDEKMQDEPLTTGKAVILLVEILTATQIAISRTALSAAQKRLLAHQLMRASKLGRSRSKDTPLYSAALESISVNVRRHAKRWSRAGR
jgi:hypothetical protein